MFEQPIAKGEFKTISTSIRQIMDNICNLQEKAKMKPFDSTYQSAICLFYGFASIENNDDLLNAIVGDLKSAGEDNKYFLMENGGLKQSIFSNYLPVYLNCLSVYLRLKKLQNNHSIYNVFALNSCPVDVVCELHDIISTSQYDLTSEWHINELFKTYFCDCALGISEKLQKLSGDENRQYLEEIYNKIIIFNKRTERTKEKNIVISPWQSTASGRR